MFCHGRVHKGLHLPCVFLGIIELKQLHDSLKEGLCIHHLDLTLIAVRGDTHIAADPILKAHKDLEFLRGFLVVKVFMVIGPYPSYGQL